MSNKRNVVIYFSQTSKKERIETDATKWGDLKSLVEGSINDKTCVLSGSKHVLALDDAALPEGEFTVFVYPKESKGGALSKAAKAKAAKKAAAKKKKPAKKVAKKKVAKKAKKVVKKAKKAKPAKKKASKPAAPKAGLGDVVSAVEQKRIAEEAALAREANEIGREIKGFR